MQRRLGDFFKRTSLVVVHGRVDGRLASPQRGEIGGGNTSTVSPPCTATCGTAPPPRLPPLGGGHTPQHEVGGRRAGVERHGKPFLEITLVLCARKAPRVPHCSEPCAVQECPPPNGRGNCCAQHLARRVLRQKTRDCLLRCRLMLGLFPVFDERGIRRQRGKLA